MQQFYTLEEASRLLNTTTDELKAMARRGELRSFQDRGTMRFRGQEIDELVRRRGLGNSDPDLQLGESVPAKPADSPAPRKPAGEGAPTDKGTFDFNLSIEDSAEVALGKEQAESAGSGKKSGKKGSDSDVRLVADGSDLDFHIDSDSDVRMVDESGSASKSGKKKGSADPVAKGDSGVRLVQEDSGSDSDVKIVPETDDNAVALGADLTKRPSDSDIRLEDATSRPPADKKKKGTIPTEEIDLDAELQKADADARKKGSSGTHRPAGAGTSPFELSDADIPVPKKKSPRKPDSSDDFELTPAKEDHSPIELGSDDLIALQPVEESAEMPKQKSPAKKPVEAEEDSSSEFELSLDDGGSSPVAEDEASSSDFDLSLEENEAPVEGESSDSEFELTLDGSGGLVAAGEPGEAESKDIFESDFEVPALEEESGSEAVALDEGDTDLESSDFDLALGDEDAPSDETSGSQVVALEDEEDSDPEAATVMRTRRGAKAEVVEGEEAGEFDNLDLEGEPQEVVEEEEGVAPVPAGAYAPSRPARWGAIPVVFMLPCVILMFLVGLMSWEMMNIMWGYHQGQKVSGLVVPWMADTFLGKDKAPKE